MLQNLFYKKNNLNRVKSAGFGLIELLISISIMILVTSIVLSQQNTFNSSVLLRSQAYEVALEAREVQLSAVSAISDGSGDFREVYGLYFSIAPSQKNGYKVFRDADDDFFFDTGEELGKQGKLDPRFVIGEIRAMEGTVVDSTPTDISIVFERPNFDAKFFSSSGELDTDISSIEIDISLDGTSDVRKIEFTKTGQISVI